MPDITLQTVQSGYDRKTCWVHARSAVIPGDPRTAIVTMHALRLSGTDVFYEINDMRSDDGGKTWTGPTPHKKTLGRRQAEEGIEEGISDLWPMYHAKTGVLLATGHTVRYLKDDLQENPRPRSSVYTTYTPETREWTDWRKIATPDEPRFFSEGAGSTQWIELENGEILLPVYLMMVNTAKSLFDYQGVSAVLRCRFDGNTLEYVESGDELTMKAGGGFVEPSIAKARGRFYLTLRNNDAAYVAVSPDGLHYDAPKRWTFDDGADLGNYNTQQHWMSHGDDLYLVYTRRGANNDHVFRHRAPLFMAKVDLDKLCVLRDTERILVPERGARLGNFGVTPVSRNESWVVVSEWMQTIAPNHWDPTICEKYGSDNSIFLAKVRFGR